MKPIKRNHSLKPKPVFSDKKEQESEFFWLWGGHTVLAALRNPYRQCWRLLATRNAYQRYALAAFDANGMDEARESTSDNILPIKNLSPKALDKMLPPNAVHQGIALQVKPLEPISVQEMIDEGIDRVVVLDQISDPQNIGAIIRSAAAFGFGAIIMQTRNAPELGGLTAKAAVGGLEYVKEVRAVNLVRAINMLNDAGYLSWALDSTGLSLETEVANNTRLPIALVLGAEGKGIRPLVKAACMQAVSIPINKTVESLNVSNAAAIAFYTVAKGFSLP